LIRDSGRWTLEKSRARKAKGKYRAGEVGERGGIDEIFVA
jgi:hypothetical protein